MDTYALKQAVLQIIETASQDQVMSKYPQWTTATPLSHISGEKYLKKINIIHVSWAAWKKIPVSWQNLVAYRQILPYLQIIESYQQLLLCAKALGQGPEYKNHTTLMLCLTQHLVPKSLSLCSYSKHSISRVQTYKGEILPPTIWNWFILIRLRFCTQPVGSFCALFPYTWWHSCFAHVWSHFYRSLLGRRVSPFCAWPVDLQNVAGQFLQARQGTSYNIVHKMLLQMPNSYCGLNLLFLGSSASWSSKKNSRWSEEIHLLVEKGWLTSCCVPFSSSSLPFHWKMLLMVQPLMAARFGRQLWSQTYRRQQNVVLSLR